MPFVNELLSYISDVFVETGTFQGDTIDIVANNDICKPSQIISLELSDVFFTKCTERFENNPKINIINGNSKYDLYNTIKDIHTKITFWLDSHWSGTPNVGCDPITVCPILEELDQIQKHHLKNHTIMIDDIFLMNNSENKYNGFPVNKDQIVNKIYEINQNYTIRFFNDYIADNDILVAYIEEEKTEKQCIHNYLTKCTTNPQPPGFADFLRGTISLYNFSKEYGYKLFLDGSEHPIFHFLKNNKNIILENPYSKTEEYLPPVSYNHIFYMLDNLFKTGTSFSILTNSFYHINNGYLQNFGEISNDCAEYMKDILTPTDEVETKIRDIFSTVYKINSDNGYKVIHLRCGDTFIHDNIYNKDVYNDYYNKIQNIIKQNNNEKYILITDSSIIGNKLSTDILELYYWDNTKIHLGDLKNIHSSSILDTIVDFFIISRSNEIISNGSGFSTINSVIFNIKYTYI